MGLTREQIQKAISDVPIHKHYLAVAEAMHKLDVEWLKSHNLATTVDRLEITSKAWERFQ